MVMATPVKQETQYAYEQAFRETFHRESETLSSSRLAIRKEGLQRFEQLGFPTKRQEAWKYIDLKPLLNTPFTPYEPGSVQWVTLAQAEPHFLQAPALRLVFVNGHYSEALSQTGSVPAGVILGSLASQENALSDSFHRETDPFAVLNASFFTEGAFLSVSDGVTVPMPIQVLFLTTGAPEVAKVAYPRGMFSVGKNARLSVVVQFVGLADHGYFNNAVLDIHAGEGAHVDLTYIQSEGPEGYNLTATSARQAAASKVSVTCVSVGGKTSRHHMGVKLLGEQAECSLNGLSVLKGRTQVYRNISVDHETPNCVSRQLFKSIVDDEARSEFDGIIIVHRDASGTDAEQLNKNLLLSDDARVYTRPQLRIDNDDVKCAHGATVGQLEDEELFYLYSRGIGKDAAQSILTYGFAEEVIQKHAQPEIHRYLDQLVLEHLK